MVVKKKKAAKKSITKKTVTKIHRGSKRVKKTDFVPALPAEAVVVREAPYSTLQAETDVPGKYDVFRVFKNTWKYFINAANVNISAGLVSCLALGLFFLWFFKFFSDKSKLLPSEMGTFFLSYIIMIIGFSYIVTFMITAYHRRGLGEKWIQPGIAGIFKSSFGGLLRVFVLSLIYMLFFILFLIPFFLIGFFSGENNMPVVIIIGYVSLIVFSVYMMIIYGPAYIIAIIEPKIIKALKESAKITKGKRLKILLTMFMLLVAIVGVEIVLILPAGVIMGLVAAKIAPGVMIGIAAIIFIPVVAVLMQLMYAFQYSVYHEVKTTVK